MMIEMICVVLLGAGVAFSVVESVAEARAMRWLPSGVSALAALGCVGGFLLLMHVTGAPSP